VGRGGEFTTRVVCLMMMMFISVSLNLIRLSFQSFSGSGKTMTGGGRERVEEDLTTMTPRVPWVPLFSFSFSFWLCLSFLAVFV